jgi:hypothetical protein
VNALADHADDRFTGAQLDRLQRFEAAPEPEEIVRERVIAAITGVVLRLRFSDDDVPWPSEADVVTIADAAIAAMRPR